MQMRWHWPPENCGGAGHGRCPGRAPPIGAPRRPWRRTSSAGSDFQIRKPRATDGEPCAGGSATRSGPGRSSAGAGVALRNSSPVGRREVDTVERHRARRRPGEVHDGPAGRRLATARLADQPERLAFETSKLTPDTAWTTWPPRGTRRPNPRRQQMADARTQVGGARAGHQPSPPSSWTRPRGRAERCGGEGAAERVVGESRGSSVGIASAGVLRCRGTGARTGNRGRRLHHVGRAAGDGVEPGVARQVDPRDRAEQRLRVGVLDVGEQTLRSAPARRTGRRTSPRPRRRGRPRHQGRE